jgi:hypothetical protein
VEAAEAAEAAEARRYQTPACTLCAREVKYPRRISLRATPARQMSPVLVTGERTRASKIARIFTFFSRIYWHVTFAVECSLTVLRVIFAALHMRAIEKTFKDILIKQQSSMCSLFYGWCLFIPCIHR